jgi:hypothetical protein
MIAIVDLPYGLVPGFSTGNPTRNAYLAALIQREQPNDAGAAVYLAKNYSFNDTPPDSYLLLAQQSRFAWAGMLTADFLASAPTTTITNALPALPPEAPTSSPFPLVAGCAIQLSGCDVILDEVSDFDSLAGALLVFVDAEIMSIATADLTANGAYSLTVVRGMFGTTIADHTADTPVFIARRGDVVPFTHPSFQTGNNISLKITIGAGSASDLEPFAFTVNGSGTGIGLDLL